MRYEKLESLFFTDRAMLYAGILRREYKHSTTCRAAHEPAHDSPNRAWASYTDTTRDTPGTNRRDTKRHGGELDR